MQKINDAILLGKDIGYVDNDPKYRKVRFLFSGDTQIILRELWDIRTSTDHLWGQVSEENRYV